MDDQFDPLQKVELALLRAEHQKRFQVMINYVKEQVGQGLEYVNPVVRILVSSTGAYYELNDLPEEFCGVIGETESHFVSRDEAVSLLTRAVEASRRAIPENTRAFQILTLYSRRGLVDRKNCFVFDLDQNGEHSARAPEIIGAFQPDVMPLFFKIKIDADTAEAVSGMERGIVFCMANAGDRHLMIRISYGARQMTDLGSLPPPKTIH